MDARDARRRGWPRFLRVVALTAIFGIVVAACGSNRTQQTAETVGGGGNTVTIGVIAPLSGPLSSVGASIKNGAQLAVAQANAANKVSGWKITLDAEDDQGKPDVAAQAASKIASNPNAVAVVGTYNSSTAQQVQPILAKANILMVSPANTNPTLTQGPDPNNRQRPYSNYFRVCTTDAIQGPYAADYAYKDAGDKTAAVINDQKVYGKGIADAFAAEFTKDGGKVVATEVVNPGDKDFTAVTTKVKTANPALVFYGGEFPEGAPLSNQIGQAGMSAPLMGGDGIQDDKYLTGGGRVNDLATSVGAPLAKLAKGQEFEAAYTKAGFKESPGAYGAYSYDAANAIIADLATVLPGKTQINDSVKQQIVTDFQKTDYEGITGKVAFDRYGDTTNKVLTVYKVEKDPQDTSKIVWVPVKTGTFQ